MSYIATVAVRKAFSERGLGSCVSIKYGRSDIFAKVDVNTFSKERVGNLPNVELVVTSSC